jgi:hypothetical protein
MCGLTLELTPPAEAGGVRLVREDSTCAADQPYAACRSGSALSDLLGGAGERSQRCWSAWEVPSATAPQKRSANQPRAGGGGLLSEASGERVTQEAEPLRAPRPEGARHGAWERCGDGAGGQKPHPAYGEHASAAELVDA